MLRKNKKETFLSRNFNLQEPDCKDEDGTFNGLICPKEQGDLLKKTISLAVLTGSIALYKGYYDFAFIGFGGALTGYLYWSNPTKSWRRTLDIVFIQSGILWHFYRSFGAENFFGYILITSIGIVFYFLGWLFFILEETWAGTLSHVLVHIFGAFSLITLYIGRIEPIGLIDVDFTFN
jgi:hypothetical protein